MKRRVVLADQPKRRVLLKDASIRHASVANLDEELGAALVGNIASKGGSPLSFVSLREEAHSRLRSTGGRPGLEGVERKKIPLTHEDWERVEQVAYNIAEPGFKPSPGQVASIMLHMMLENWDASAAAEAKRNLKRKVA
jgi:hypothetical protein